MPHEYHNLTPAEREEILRIRREKGYPLHAPPHPFRQAGTYLITASNFGHASIMAKPSRRTDFQGRLLAAMQSIEAEIAGWVILSNHYHILVGVVSLNLISSALKTLHAGTSFEWNKAEEMTGKRRIWYKFYDRMIRDEAHYWAALNYIHINPKKHGYEVDPYCWPWSSLHVYYEDKGRDWLRETWQKNMPANDFGKSWDDL